MNTSSWTPKERLISAAFAGLAVVALIAGLVSGIAPLSSEFFSLLALLALLLGLAFTPSILFKPLKQSLGDEISRALRLGFGAFCVLQLIAVALKVFGPAP